jgi:hypothetical protein
LSIAGTILAAIATIALLIGPGPDPTGAGEIYDKVVEEYNKQAKEVQESNPSMPAPALGKTRLQAHREDAAFGLIVGCLVLSAGLLLYFRNWPGTAKIPSP